MRIRAVFMLAVLELAVCGCTDPDQAASQSPTGGATNFDTPCIEPVPPSTNQDELAVSAYQAQRQHFIDCVAGLKKRGQPVDQRSLDESLAAIGNDPLESTDEAQQDIRGAVEKIGLDRDRR